MISIILYCNIESEKSKRYLKKLLKNNKKASRKKSPAKKGSHPFHHNNNLSASEKSSEANANAGAAIFAGGDIDLDVDMDGGEGVDGNVLLTTERSEFKETDRRDHRGNDVLMDESSEPKADVVHTRKPTVGTESASKNNVKLFNAYPFSHFSNHHHRLTRLSYNKGNKVDVGPVSTSEEIESDLTRMGFL